MKDYSILNQTNEDENWVSVSDMMAGLMMVFLFISVIYMIQINKEKDKAVSIAQKDKAKAVNIAKQYIDLNLHFALCGSHFE